MRVLNQKVEQTKSNKKKEEEFMQLKCSACECVHNIEENCNAHVIQVNESGRGRRGKDVFCNTYAESQGESKKQPKVHMKSPTLWDSDFNEEYAADFSDESPLIACMAAKCMYNKSFGCIASDVNILAPGEKNMKCECETFCPR